MQHTKPDPFSTAAEYAAIRQISEQPRIKTAFYLSSEWWLVYLTAALSAFTLGLMIYTDRHPIPFFHV